MVHFQKQVRGLYFIKIVNDGHEDLLKFYGLTTHWNYMALG